MDAIANSIILSHWGLRDSEIPCSLQARHAHDSNTRICLLSSWYRSDYHCHDFR